MPAPKLTVAIVAAQLDKLAETTAAADTHAEETVKGLGEQIASLQTIVTGLVKDVEDLLKLRDYLRKQAQSKATPAKTTARTQPKPQAQTTAKTAKNSAIKTVTRPVQPPNGKPALTSMAQYTQYKDAVKAQAIATQKPVNVIAYSVAQNMAYDRLMATLKP